MTQTNIDILLHQAKKGEKKAIDCIHSMDEEINYWKGRREALEDLNQLNKIIDKWNK